MSYTQERARVASLSRRLPANHPDLVQARQEFQAARFIDRVNEIVSAAPPLTPAQRDTIAAAFAGFAPGASDAA